MKSKTIAMKILGRALVSIAISAFFNMGHPGGVSKVSIGVNSANAASAALEEVLVTADEPTNSSLAFGAGALGHFAGNGGGAGGHYGPTGFEPGLVVIPDAAEQPGGMEEVLVTAVAIKMESGMNLSQFITIHIVNQTPLFDGGIPYDDADFQNNGALFCTVPAPGPNDGWRATTIEWNPIPDIIAYPLIGLGVPAAFLSSVGWTDSILPDGFSGTYDSDTRRYAIDSAQLMDTSSPVSQLFITHVHEIMHGYIDSLGVLEFETDDYSFDSNHPLSSPMAYNTYEGLVEYLSLAVSLVDSYERNPELYLDPNGFTHNDWVDLRQQLEDFFNDPLSYFPADPDVPEDCVPEPGNINVPPVPGGSGDFHVH